MPMHTTGEETRLRPSRADVEFGRKLTPPITNSTYIAPPHLSQTPPPDFSSVTSQPSHSPPANPGYYSFTGDGSHYLPPIVTMLWPPSELSPPELSPSELSDEPPTEYDFAPSRMTNDWSSYFDVPVPSDPLLNASKCKRAAPMKKAEPIDENQGDEAILDALLDKSRSDQGYSVDIRINNLVKQVTEVLSKSNISDQLRDLSVEEAQCTLDFLQDLLDVSGLPPISKRTLLKTSLRLTRIHDCVPRCLVLKGFKKTGDRAFSLGHFGELWRGEIEGVEVAVKQARIFTNDNNIKKVLREVRREAIIWRQCDHPNVLPFYGIFRDSAPSTYCLVSPFLDNGSLRRYMNKTVDPDRHKLALDITCGMDYLHTLSIVHGDLKGDNVLITDDCRAVITDFGISFVMGVTTFATSTSSHKGGTIRWEAPEVLSGSPNSFPADVYSLACVYFEVFDGTIPWNNLRDGAVIKTVIVEKKHPPRPRELQQTGIHDLWWRLMVQCWAHEPSDRPTVHDLMESLHPIGDPLRPTRNWDNPVLGRLRDSPVNGELAIPSGLPPFLDIKGEGTTASMTSLNNDPTLDNISPLGAFLQEYDSDNLDSFCTIFEDIDFSSAPTPELST
ncbi:kinase-like protein [Armillaria solidipes]|uniref:Kinase-like protein n=1 Tax=Armillaria solidipes TaxID=1076256 RepID=A0A2H3BUQ1_9AGAR|nr:kinase-like protein [Armillaria solidipes]